MESLEIQYYCPAILEDGEICGLPIEVKGDDVLSSTDGGTLHVRTECTDNHRFILPIDRLLEELFSN